jgi:hypothetical protein
MRGPISLPLIVAILLGFSGIGMQVRVSAAHQKQWLQSAKVELTIMTMLYSLQAHDTVTAVKFKIEDPISIAMTMTNRSNEVIHVGILGGPIGQFRLRLLKDGVPVPYREEIRKAIANSEDNFYIGGSAVGYGLSPNNAQQIGSLDLKLWYGALEPGRYDFKLKFRFTDKKRAIVSNTVTFEVSP